MAQPYATMASMGNRREKRVIEMLVFTSDALSIAVAVLVATIVMGASFLRGVEGFAVAVRACLAFAVTYVVAYALMLYVRQSALKEYQAAKKRKRREAAQAAKRAEGGPS